MGCFDSAESNQAATGTNFQPWQNDLAQRIAKLYEQRLGTGANVYQGDRVAGFNPLQSGAVNAAGNFSSIFGNPASQGNPLMDETGKAIGGLLSGQSGAQKISDVERDEYFQKSIYDPTMRTMKEDLIPTVDEAYAGGDFFGSARGKARNQLAEDIGNSLLTQKSNLNWNVLQSNQALDEAKAGRQLSAVGQGMEYSRLPAQQTMDNLNVAISQVAGLKELFGIGSAEQTQEQREILADMAKFAEEYQLTDPESLSVLMALVNRSFGTDVRVGSTEGAGLGYAFLGGAAGQGGQNFGNWFFQ